MIEQKLRPFVQNVLVDSVARFLADKCKPNTITILSFVVGLFSAICVFVNPYLSIVLLLLSGYFDVLDGSLARLRESSSNIGTMLDILSDRFVESFMIISIFVYQPQLAWVGLLMMMSILVCISSFLLLGIFTQNDTHKSFYYSPGLIERAETFLFFIAMIIFPSLVFYLGLIYTVLVLWTTGYRCYEFYLHEKNKEIK
jgi:phosphatidylglycerophosphate synthase